MFWKIVKNDFTRKTVITLAVFVFITMAVTLGAGAANIIANLSQSIAQLKQHAMPADIAQMHAGAYAQQQIDAFTREQREHIAMQETMTLLNVEGIAIEYGGNQTLAGTVQDISFAVQNKKFDFLLDLNNEKLDVKEGEVAVPIYFMVANGLTTGDPITVSSGGYRHDFIISNYVRDYEMNASLASSKRFVVHQADFDRMLENNAGELEYMIEFRLTQNGNAKAVETAYVKAGLPANGPMVGAMVFMLFNALSDVAIAMVIILISILLMMISALCIKLIFLAAIDEDLREIGVMKAMGISKKDIRKVYLTKYRVLSLAAGVLGYLLSFGVVHLFSGNMRLYLSGDLSGNLKYALSLMAPILVYLTVVACCKKTLKKIDGISAVEALRCELTARGKPRKYSFQLLKNRFFSTNIYMGLRDVGTRFKLYRILLVIFAVSVLIVILPLNVYNTMNSPEFSTYMGIGKSDLRIDLRKTDTIKEDLLRLHNDLQSDPDVLHAAAYITCYYQVKNMAGSWDYLSIETGDFSVFPLNYLKGKAPAGEGEISLSFANASKTALTKQWETKLSSKSARSKRP